MQRHESEGVLDGVTSCKADKGAHFDRQTVQGLVLFHFGPVISKNESPNICNVTKNWF